MGQTTARASSHVDSALREGIAHLRGTGMVPDHGRQDMYHKIYTLSPEDIRSGAGLADARLVGHRHIVLDGDRPVGAVELRSGESESDVAFQAFNKGPFVAGTHKWFGQADRLFSGDRELSLLRIPELYVAALWFRGDDPDGDVLIPMPPAHHFLEPDKPMPAGAFMEALRRIAAEAVEWDTTGD